MNILILGGTVFLGRHIVDAATTRGHRVTLFNRGKHGAGLFSGLEQLRGDRAGDLSALRDRRWDAVVDTCGNHPRAVAASARLLAENVEHYTYISTVSVYRDFPVQSGLDESAPTAELSASSAEEISESNFGALKAASERALVSALPGRALLVRPGLIVGPHDPTGRLTYWPLRIAEGGEVLAPGDPDAPMQLIDVRDIAAWIVLAIERRLTGPFNVAGREYVITMSELLELCQLECGRCTLTWRDDAFLLSHGVVPRRDLPLWSPNALGAMTIATTKARSEGLFCQDLRATVRDTFLWASALPPERRPRNWLSRTRESELLNAAPRALASGPAY